VNLHHDVTGSGPALLLLHSTACDSRQWDPQRDALAERWTVVTTDFRGFGQSPLPPGPYSHAGDVLHLLDHLGIEAAAVVGSSGGGSVALQVACAAPDRVSSLVLLCAAADGVERSAALRSFGARENALLESGDIAGATRLNVETWLGPEADDAAREHVAAMQEHAFRVQLAAADQPDEEEELDVTLSRISAPTTVVFGRHDLDHFASVARYLAAGLPHAELIELDWSGHLPNLERPAAITALIDAAAQQGGTGGHDSK